MIHFNAILPSTTSSDSLAKPIKHYFPNARNDHPIYSQMNISKMSGVEILVMTVLPIAMAIRARPIATAIRARISSSDSLKFSTHQEDIRFQLDDGDGGIPKTISGASSVESIEVTLDQDPPRSYSCNYTSVKLFHGL
jgi:hypothetical protein